MGFTLKDGLGNKIKKIQNLNFRGWDLGIILDDTSANITEIRFFNLKENIKKFLSPVAGFFLVTLRHTHILKCKYLQKVPLHTSIDELKKFLNR